MMNENVYQRIYDELNQFLMPEWEKLIAYFEYGNASYSFSFYVKSGAEYVKCYDLPNITEDELLLVFGRLDKIISKERGNEKEAWSNMTMVIDKSGRMHTDFDYTDLSKGNYQYKKNWKKKYLV